MKKINDKDVTVSVTMATYNGKDFIENQITSILNNLEKNDELIISDDGSTDGTLDIIRKYVKEDKRVKLLEGPKKGVIKNFENALYKCTGEYIFLSDQDDYWQPNKREIVLNYFEKENIIALVHDAQIVDENDKVIMESWFKHRKSKKGLIYNLIKNRYLGCCMAFKKELLTYSMPMPDDIEMHDWWLGLVAEKKGKTLFINEKLINYRRHSKNVSSLDHYPLKKMIKNRIVFIKRLVGR